MPASELQAAQAKIRELERALGLFDFGGNVRPSFNLAPQLASESGSIPT